jgi:Flp pilus assembly protein TadD
MKSNWIVIALAAFGLSGCGTESKEENVGLKSSTVKADARSNEGAKDLDALLTEGDSAEVKTGSQDTVAAAPASAYAELGKASEFGNESMATEAAMKLLGKNPNDVKALNVLGLNYLKANRPSLARMILTRAIGIDKSNAALFNNVGQAYLRLGETQLAIDSFKKALDVDKNNLAAAANLGTLYVKFGNYQKAIDLLERAHEANPKDEALANNFSVALRGMKEFSEAEKVLRDTASRTRNVVSLLNYAEVLVELKKDTSRAKQILNKIKVLSTDPGVLREVDAMYKKVE